MINSCKMSDSKEQEKGDMKQDDHIVDNAGLNMSGHILIRDKESGEELINKRNAIHYGNMARIVALALNNGLNASKSVESTNSFINSMAFGNGGSSVDTSGKVLYKTPRVSEAYEASANLYNNTYSKEIDDNQVAPDDNKIEIITGASYTDIKITVTLAYNEPSGQSVFDDSTNNEGDYIFDELGLFTESNIMLTHVIFHPVQKSQNRVIEIIYTVRVQLS